MTRTLLIGLIVLAGAAVLFGLATAGMRGLVPVEETVLTRAVSPDGRYVATLVERDAGATTNFATQVRVARRGPLGRVLRAVVFSLDGRAPVTLRWQGRRALLIRCPQGHFYDAAHRREFEIYTARPRWRDLTFRYRTQTGTSRGMPAQQ